MFTRFAAGLGLLVVISAFQNCKIADLVLAGEPVNRITYSAKGGMAPHGYPQLNERLELILNGDMVDAYRNSGNCEKRAMIKKAHYDELSDLIIKSPVRIGTMVVMDGGTSTVRMERKSFTQQYHLDDDGGSYGQEILVDGDQVQVKINKIMELLPCPPPPNPWAAVVYRRELPNRIDLPATGRFDDVKLGVNFVSPVGQTLSGYIVAYDYGNGGVSPKVCTTEFNQTPLDVDLTREAAALKVHYSDVICAVQAIWPGYGFVEPFMELTDQTGRSQRGYLICTQPNRMENSQPYLEKLDSWLAKHDRCSPNPLGIRPPSSSTQ